MGRPRTYNLTLTTKIVAGVKTPATTFQFTHQSISVYGQWSIV